MSQTKVWQPSYSKRYKSKFGIVQTQGYGLGCKSSTRHTSRNICMRVCNQDKNNYLNQTKNIVNFNNVLCVQGMLEK